MKGLAHCPYSPAEYAVARSCRKSGILLVECVVYLAVFAVVLGLSYMALSRTWATHRSLLRSAQDIAKALSAGEQWRADVRAAAGGIEMAKSPSDWLMRIHETKTTIIYRLDHGALFREVSTPPGHSALIGNVKSTSMELDRRTQVKTCRWELELQSKNPKAKVHPLFTFTAVAPEVSP